MIQNNFYSISYYFTRKRKQTGWRNNAIDHLIPIEEKARDCKESNERERGTAQRASER